MQQIKYDHECTIPAQLGMFNLRRRKKKDDTKNTVKNGVAVFCNRNIMVEREELCYTYKPTAMEDSF
jgi:hypothetical protein